VNNASLVLILMALANLTFIAYLEPLTKLIAQSI
ncbi:MAG: hypothetical protein ACJATU_001170, partial [Rickettsiales bacterium]